MPELIQYGIWLVIFAILMAIPSTLTQWYFYKCHKNLYTDSPFFSSWKRLQSELADTLHHPHPEAKEMDELLEKLEKNTLAGLSSITPPDRARLVVLLRERVDDPKQTNSERTRAELLLFAMRRVESEQELKQNLDPAPGKR